MRRILAIMRKDTLLRFSSRSEFLFFLVLPIIFTLILGRGLDFGSTDGGIPVLAVDEDGSPLSAQLVGALARSASVEVQLIDRVEAEGRFEDSEAPALLIIPAGFEAALLGGQPVDLAVRVAPDDTNGLVAQQAVRAAAGAVGRTLTVAHASVAEAERLRPFAGEAERSAYFSASLDQAREAFAAAPERLRATQPEGALSESGGGFDLAAHQSAGQLITWVLIPLLGTSGLFAYERTHGTLRRLITTPTSKATFLLGTIAGQLAMAIVQMAILVGFGILVMGLRWGHSPAALAVMLLAFGLASVALGTMLGTFVKTDSQANGVSILLGMSMALLGGCWYPQEAFPPVAQAAAQALPTSWAMRGLSDIVVRGQGLAEVMPEAGALLLFASLFFVVGVWRFRYE